MQAQLSELKKMFCKLSETINVNKSRVEHYTGVSFPDSKGYTESRNTRKGHRNKKRSFRRHSLKTSLTYNTRVQNEKYIKNFSNKALSNDEVKLVSRGLKFIPSPPIPSSNKSLLKDFNTSLEQCVWNICSQTKGKPLHLPSMLNRHCNNRSKTRLPLKITWKKQNLN